MAGATSEISPWNRRTLTIPPNSLLGWFRLAIWEFWMGTLVCGFVSFGAFMIVTAPERIITGEDLSRCYAPPPIEQPCDRVVYKTGALNAAFTALFGGLLLLGAAWFMWELWSAVEPKPITDDFLKILNDSFGRNWRDPRTWPWSRLFYAYGFTLLGATSTAIVGMMIWTLVGSSHPGKPPTASVGTSQTFRVSP